MIRAHFLFYLLGFISSVIMVITSFRKVPDKLRLSEKNETRLVIVMIVLGFLIFIWALEMFIIFLKS